MKKYLLFIYHMEEPSGGMSDYRGSANCLSGCKQMISNWNDTYPLSENYTIEVVDIETGTILKYDYKTWKYT